MGAVAFNTYEFIKSLEDAGMDEKQAEAITTGMLRVYESANLATKTDLREMQIQTKADLRELELRMTIKLGSMLIIAVGVLGAMMKLL